MTYDQLVTLKSIVETGSFKAASQKLHKSQPSLSVAIKKLEDEFQIKIFSREQYRPELTKIGRAFYEKALLALKHMENLEGFARQLTLGNEAQIVVGIDGIAPFDFLLKKLNSFFGEHPQTNLNLNVDYLSGTKEKLLEQKVDFSFCPLYGADNKDFEHKTVANVTMIPVCAKDYFPAQFHIDDIVNFPQVIIADSGKYQTLSAGVLEGARKWIVSDLYSKYKIIKAGMGWGALPTHMIAHELTSGKFIEISGHPQIHRRETNIYMVRNLKRPLGPVAKKLWERFPSDSKKQATGLK